MLTQNPTLFKNQLDKYTKEWGITCTPTHLAQMQVDVDRKLIQKTRAVGYTCDDFTVTIPKTSQLSCRALVNKSWKENRATDDVEDYLKMNYFALTGRNPDIDKEESA
jgi:hypothetical protein